MHGALPFDTPVLQTGNVVVQLILPMSPTYRSLLWNTQRSEEDSTRPATFLSVSAWWGCSSTGSCWLFVCRWPRLSQIAESSKTCWCRRQGSDTWTGEEGIQSDLSSVLTDRGGQSFQAYTWNLCHIDSIEYGSGSGWKWWLGHSHYSSYTTQQNWRNNLRYPHG